MLPSLLVGTGSSAYLCYEGYKVFQFYKFKKYGQDGNFRIVRGELNPTNEIKIGSNFMVAEDGSIVKDKTDRLIRKVIVDEGHKKTGTYYTPVKVGKSTIMIPHTYTYTDYKNIFSETYWIKDFKLGKIPVRISDISRIEMSVPLLETKMYPNHTDRPFKILGLDSKYPTPSSNKYRFKEGHLSFGETISIAGEFKDRKNITPRYMGSRNVILNMIRRQRYHVSWFGIGLATIGLIGSLIFIDEELNSKNKRKWN